MQKVKRAAARAICRDFTPTTYRGDVDVDINGYIDPPGMTRSKEVTLPCGL